MDRRTRGKARRFAVWCMALCMSLLWMLGAAQGEIALEIVPDEWSWEAGGISSFHGTVTAQEDLPETELNLGISSALEDDGLIQFLEIDGKKLKIRKRGPDATVDLEAGRSIPFSGEWVLPDELETEIAYAEIILSVKNSAGEELATISQAVGDRAEEEAKKNANPLRQVDRMIFWLGICGVGMWLLALGRYFFLNRAKKGI